MNPSELMEAINAISHEKGLDQATVIETIEDALVGAAYKKYKQYKDIEAQINPKQGTLDLVHYKQVVEKVLDSDNEISLHEARTIDNEVEIGDDMEYVIDIAEFTKVIAQTTRQLIFQKINEKEKEVIYKKYINKKSEILYGTVARVERNRTIVMIGSSVEASLPYKEQIQGEHLKAGDHTRAVLLEIDPEARGPQLIISRRHPLFLIKLLESEVPEVYDGIVEIVEVARDPGRRSKVAVTTKDADIDPVGACIGMRGSHIQAVINELNGERIDVIEYSPNLEKFIANTLAPAEVLDITIDKENEQAEVKTLPEQLSLAIGKQGQNVRLASRLTHVNINISAYDSTPVEAFERAKQQILQEETNNPLSSDNLESNEANLEDSSSNNEANLEATPSSNEANLEDTSSSNEANLEDSPSNIE